MEKRVDHDNADSQDEWEPLAKQTKVDNTCIIHCSDNPGKIVLVDSLDKWNDLVTAATNLDNENIMEIARVTPVGSIPPNVVYHKNCRNVFLLRSKRTKEKSKSKLQTSDSDQPSSSKSTRVRRVSSSQLLLPKECIFCRKTYKYEKGKKMKANKIGTIDARDSIILAQSEMKDSHIEHLINNYDLTSAEAHYHRSCYRAFTRILSKPPEQESHEDSESTQIRKVEAEVLLSLKKDYIQKKQVLTMVKLFEQYKSLLPKDLTLSEERYQYLRRRMKTRIEHELHDLLIVHTMGNGRILLIPKTLSLNDVVEENFKLSEIIEKDSLISQEAKMVINVANILRQSFHNHKPSLSWPPNVSELDMGEMKMSELSLLFWKSLFDVPKSRELSIKELSLIQDLSYATTRVPYPKHFLLTILTRALSGNVELITTLNRLGHGISHSGLLEVMTAVAMQKVKDTALNDVVLPDELQFGEPTTLVFDNIDRLEETLSGSGTSHRVNGIAVQRGFIGPRVEKKRASMSKTKRRSIQIEDIFLTPYNVGTKPPPPYLMGLVQRYKKFHRSFSLSKEDVLWVIARYIHQKCQNIPSWTGFNILLRTENMVIKDNIGYLPSINHPATSMATINEMLCQALRIKDQIGIESIVLVCDQAIYAKAIEVAWADQEKFEPIILRLGTFHTICTFLAVIGKRFADAGLRDIAIESAAIAEGSVKGAFQGKQYNRAVRFHKLLYEALMRILWEKFCNRIDDSETAESSILREISERLSENPTNETYNGILLDPRFDVLINSFSVFFDNVQAQRGTMSTFWMSYMTMVKTLLDIIRASREGNLLLHLESVESIIPCVLHITGQTTQDIFLIMFRA